MDITDWALDFFVQYVNQTFIKLLLAMSEVSLLFTDVLIKAVRTTAWSSDIIFRLYETPNNLKIKFIRDVSDFGKWKCVLLQVQWLSS